MITLDHDLCVCLIGMHYMKYEIFIVYFQSRKLSTTSGTKKPSLVSLTSSLETSVDASRPYF